MAKRSHPKPSASPSASKYGPTLTGFLKKLGDVSRERREQQLRGSTFSQRYRRNTAPQKEADDIAKAKSPLPGTFGLALETAVADGANKIKELSYDRERHSFMLELDDGRRPQAISFGGVRLPGPDALAAGPSPGRPSVVVDPQAQRVHVVIPSSAETLSAPEPSPDELLLWHQSQLRKASGQKGE
jgi:hypothetical protein